MIRLRSAVAVAVTLALAITSPSRGDASPPYDTDYSGTDWTLSILAGIGGGLGGALLGGLVGHTVHDALVADSRGADDTAVVVGSIGFSFACSAAIYGTGHVRGHRGSYWATVGGTSAATLLGLGLTWFLGMSESDLGITGLLSTVVLGPILGTLAYTWTLESGVPEPTPTGGLIDINEGVVRVGMPDIGFGLGREGGIERLDVKLIGGRF